MSSIEQAFANDSFGAWVLKCDPRIYPIEDDIAVGSLEGEWSTNARSQARTELMEAGQQVLLFVNSGEPAIQPGLIASGHLTGRIRTDLPGATRDLSAWKDQEAAARRTAWAPVELQFRESAVPVHALKDQPQLGEAEFLRAPQVSPAFVTKAELKVITTMMNVAHYRAPQNTAIRTNGSPSNAAELKRKVELAAMDFVTNHYVGLGYEAIDVSAQNKGWDITFRSVGQEPLHVEVKGTRSSLPKIILTRNEMKHARETQGWTLAVVTSALEEPRLSSYPADIVQRLAEPSQFNVDLSTEPSTILA